MRCPRYIDWEYLSEIRSLWKGPIILKGILDEENAIQASKVVECNISFKSWWQDKLILCRAPLQLLPNIRKKLGKDFPIIIDSGYLSGQDIAKALVLGADFVMLGRAFMIGVSALGKKGAEHVHYILHDELSNIMEADVL